MRAKNYKRERFVKRYSQSERQRNIAREGMRKKRERYSQRMKPKNGDCRLIFMINITIEGEMNNTDNFTRLNI